MIQRGLLGGLTVRRAVAATGLFGFLAVGAGCESKGFLDPTEVGRFERTPLVVPILDKLVVGVEADELQYSSAREVSAEDLKPVSRDYRVGPNDLVQVTIQDLAGAGTQSAETKRVSESGKISLPYLNQISVTGMTEAEAEDAIVKAYADAQILPKAIVGVSVVESQNRIYTISGAINQQGSYPLTRGDLRLLDAISNARGVTSELGIDYIYIIRRKPSGTETTKPAGTPGAPGVDPLAPTSRAKAAGRTTLLTMVTDEQPAGPAATQPAAGGMTPDPMTPAPMTPPIVTPDPMIPAPTTPNENTRDRVIQIEGAGTQPANGVDPMSPGATPPMTTVPPVSTPPSGYDPLAPGPVTPPTDASATTTPFEFTAPAEPTDQEVIKVPYALLSKRGELKYNIVIQAQDLIVVPSPPIGEYYMAAHSARPGVYSLSARRITLKQAVISAGGLDQLAIPARTDVIRRIGTNQEMYVRVDLERIFSGLEPDIFLKPDDQVIIGTNIGAPFLSAIRNAFRITYGFGFLYDRNYAPGQTTN